MAHAGACETGYKKNRGVWRSACGMVNPTRLRLFALFFPLPVGRSSPQAGCDGYTRRSLTFSGGANSRRRSACADRIGFPDNWPNFLHPHFSLGTPGPYTRPHSDIPTGGSVNGCGLKMAAKFLHFALAPATNFDIRVNCAKRVVLCFRMPACVQRIK